MPIPEERLYRPGRINRWFAVSSLLMTGSLFWMIWIDYDRPWRAFQDHYYLGRAALAHLDFLDASREENTNRLKEAEQRLADRKEYVEKTDGAKRAKLQAELAHASLEFLKANAPWSKAFQVLEVTKDTYERNLGDHGPDHPDTQSAHKQFLDEEKKTDELRVAKEKWEDEKRHIEEDLRRLEKDLRTAEKEVADLKAVADTARQKDMQFRGVLTDDGILGGLPVVSALINAPLGDFTAPKNTPGRHQVNQLVLPNVRQRLNYLESYTTDRCTTCHVAIDDPDFSKQRLAHKLEDSIPGVSEAMRRLGKPAVTAPPPPKSSAGKEILQGKVAEHWSELTRKDQDKYFDELLAVVNNYLKLSGRKTIELAQPILAHPDLDLFVNVDSAHPMAKIGCTVCHEGNPQETDFVQAAHSPATHKQQEDWASRYYITLLGIPNITFETISHFWDRPMRLPQYTEAGCVKCHSQVTDIAKFRGEPKGRSINLGQHLFREVGCINCHEEKSLAGSRKVGPDLSHVAAKLTPGFVQQWAFFPQKFRPSTRMPHFFQQENNRAESVNRFDTEPVLRTKTEVAAISKYLFAVSRPWKPKSPPDGITGDVTRGKELFNSLGCLACHANLAEYGEPWITKDLMHRESLDVEKATFRYKGMTDEQRARYAMEHFPDQTETIFEPEVARFNPDREYNPPTFSRFAPELSGIGSKVKFDWLYSWLLQPDHYAPDTKMPSLRLLPGEAADIASYLLTLKREDYDTKEFEVNDASKKMADDLMFSILASQRSERRSLSVMKDEGDELTKMLVATLKTSFGKRAVKEQELRVTSEEEKSIGEQVAYDLIRPMTLEDKKSVFLGSKMIGHYGCYACHIIPGFEETTPPGTELTTWAEKPITQLDFAFFDHAFHHMREKKDDVFGYVYPKDAKELNERSPIPDDAREEITHTHGAFAKHKMLNPRIWDREKIKKPYDKLKMPNFYFTEHEAEALTTFLLSRMPARVEQSLQANYDGTELGPIAKGRHLARELNCVACHQIEDNAPAVQQYIRRNAGGKQVFDEVNAPPLLWGEGAKLQHNWFHSFLKNVETLRPWLRVRMPSFKLTGDQATTLVEYFAALSKADNRLLAKTTVPVHEFFEKEKIAKSKPKEGEPGSDWWQKDQFAAAAQTLRRWAIERKLMRAGELDLLANPVDKLAAAHAKLGQRIEFLESLYNVEYPFVEPPKPLENEARFASGAGFLNDMGCLKCHVMGRMLPGPAQTTDDFIQTYRLDSVRGEGDNAVALLNGVPYAVGSTIDGHKLISAKVVYYEDTGDSETKAVVEGPNAKGEIERVQLLAASAPNLSLAHQRLRRAWVYDWMLEPQWITPGTKMPQNFPRDEKGVPKSPFLDDPRYPGNGFDHINLLVDYLYDAGLRGARVPLPKTIAPKEQEGFEEAEEFKD